MGKRSRSEATGLTEEERVRRGEENAVQRRQLEDAKPRAFYEPPRRRSISLKEMKEK